MSWYVYRFFHQQTTRRHETDQAEAGRPKETRRGDFSSGLPPAAMHPSERCCTCLNASRPDDARARTAHQHQPTSAATLHLHLNRSGDPLRTPHLRYLGFPFRGTNPVVGLREEPRGASGNRATCTCWLLTALCLRRSIPCSTRPDRVGVLQC